MRNIQKSKTSGESKLKPNPKYTEQKNIWVGNLLYDIIGARDWVSHAYCDVDWRCTPYHTSKNRVLNRRYTHPAIKKFLKEGFHLNLLKSVTRKCSRISLVMKKKKKTATKVNCKKLTVSWKKLTAKLNYIGYLKTE